MKFQTTVAAPKAVVMSEAEMFAAAEAFEQFHDSVVNGEDATALEVFENLTAVKDMINSKDSSLNRVINNDPELLAMFRESKGSMEAFATAIVSNLDAAEEGFGKDLWWDSLLGAIWHRNDTTIKHLKPLVDTLLDQVEKADDKKFEKWKMFRQINVFSKYLPDYEDYAKCASALKAAANYLIRTSPDKFDAEAFKKTFAGSIYAKKDGKLNTNTTVGAHLLFQLDIRKRGWHGKDRFIEGLKLMKNLIGVMEKLDEAINKNKSGKFDDAAKAAVKGWCSGASNVANLMGHLGRGITAAARKVSGSVLNRLFTLEM